MPTARRHPAVAPIDSSGSSVVLPILGYSPDSGFLVGGMLLRFFQLDAPQAPSRSSVFSPVLMYTTRNQVLAFLGTELNWGQNRWQAGLVPGYMKMPDQFWGIGRETRDQDEEDYTPELLRFEVSLNRRIFGHLRGGLVIRAMRHRLIETSAGGLLESGRIPGVGNRVVVAPGLRVAFDSRDHAWSPTSGHWLQGGVDFASGTLGSDDDFNQYLLDLRTYYGMGDGGVVAAQVLATHCDGDAPFFVLPQLGGMEGLRGYRASRYLDRTRAAGPARVA